MTKKKVTQEEIAKEGLPHTIVDAEEVKTKEEATIIEDMVKQTKKIADMLTGKEIYMDIDGEREQFIEHCLRVLRLPNQKFVKRWLKDKYPFLKEDTYGNLYHFVKDTPLLNAHMDNVGDAQENSMAFNIDMWTDPKTNKDYFANKWMIGKGKDAKMVSFNIGADDKCGVAIHTWIYDKIGDKVSLLFTCDEEGGCKGSRYFINTFKDEDGKSGEDLIKENNLYCILADRRNENDFVGHKNMYCSKEWEDKALVYVGMYGYKSVSGLVSDANQIKTAVNCVNMSCGYYNPHESNEYAVVDEMVNCCDAIMFLVLNFKEKLSPYKYEYSAPTYPRQVGGGRNQLNLPFHGMGNGGVIHETHKGRYMKGKVYRPNKKGIWGRYDPLPEGHKRAADGSRGSSDGDLGGGSDDHDTPMSSHGFDAETFTSDDIMDDYYGMYDTHVPHNILYQNIHTGDEIYIPAGYYLTSELLDPEEYDNELRSIIG